MKILASDYDGTICLEGIVSEGTRKAIKEWKDRGNLFAVVTGRDIRMTKDVVEEHNIPFDFLICNNGCVIYDDKFQEIKSSYLPDHIVKALIYDDDIATSSYIVLADEKGRYVYDNEYVEGKYPTVYYTDVLTETDILKPNHFYQMDTRYPDAEQMHITAWKLERKYGKEVMINPNLTTIDITPKGVNKLTGLQAYVKLKQLRKEDVITVGDGLNDKDMIHYFNGYAMAEAVDAIKNGAKGVVASVEELINREL